MGYFETAKEYIVVFMYWREVAFFIGGMIFVYNLQIISKMLRTRRLLKKGKSTNMVVIESLNHRKRKRKDVNAIYFEYVKNSQYFTRDIETNRRPDINR